MAGAIPLLLVRIPLQHKPQVAHSSLRYNTTKYTLQLHSYHSAVTMYKDSRAKRAFWHLHTSIQHKLHLKTVSHAIAHRSSTWE